MTGKKQAQAKKKPAPKQKLTNAERHKRFVDMAREVQAEESPDAFDKAFDDVVTSPKRPAPPPSS